MEASNLPTSASKIPSPSENVPLNYPSRSYVSKRVSTSAFQSRRFGKFRLRRAGQSLMNRHKNWVRRRRKSLTNLLHIPSRSSRPADQPGIVPPLCKRSESWSSNSRDQTMDIDASAQQSWQRDVVHKVSFNVKGNPFKIDSRYSYLKTLGFGAYGIVCAATDTKTQRRVAVKKVSNVFEDLTDAKRIIREIRLLRCMNHDNILKILDIDEPENYSTFNDVYIVTELMDTDLAKLLRSSAKLLESQRKYFVYHILRALQYIHSVNIMHRDLKPANILVSESVCINVLSYSNQKHYSNTTTKSHQIVSNHNCTDLYIFVSLVRHQNLRLWTRTIYWPWRSSWSQYDWVCGHSMVPGSRIAACQWGVHMRHWHVERRVYIGRALCPSTTFPRSWCQASTGAYLCRSRKALFRRNADHY